MPKAPLQETLAGIFSELGQHIFGKAIPVTKLERMNMLARKFGLTILQSAEEMALKKCKALNDAVKSGFGLMAKDVADLQARVDELTARLDADQELINDMQELEMRIEALEERADPPITETIVEKPGSRVGDDR